MADVFQHIAHEGDPVQVGFSGTSDEFRSPPEPPALQDLLDKLPHAVLLLNHDWRIVYANAEARRISRIPSDAIGKQTHWELFPDTVGTELEQRYRDAMDSGTSGRMQYYFGRFDLWVDIALHPGESGLTLYF